MKKILPLMMILAAATPAFAQGHANPTTQTLNCVGDTQWERLELTLDYRDFDAGSGYFNVTQANIVDNYASAQLTCTGHRPDEITCIGFLFGIGDYITKISVRKEGDKLVAQSKMLEGDMDPFHAMPWQCTIQ
ncbi:MAG TPA: hypothetical protein VL588_08665 [Bdellovibrionota bacterium]|nr:hypothetical protein [Bdellovibrionota bacterium]